MREAIEQFDCFGGSCAVLVAGSGPAGSAHDAAARVRRRLLAWHDQFSRFLPNSELSRLNADPRHVVPVSPTMARFVATATSAARVTGGLVDPTLVDDVEAAGYSRTLSWESLPLTRALLLAPGRVPGRGRAPSAWAEIEVDRVARTVTRPPGVRLDSGGIFKGLCGDMLAAVLGRHVSFAVDAAGDVRFGGAGEWRRPVRVTSPFDNSLLHMFELVHGAAATSGIGRRSWLGEDGRPAHHLLDPATGRPAFTGVVQVTALAPTGVEAETRSKAALLSGPAAATDWLVDGGVVVFDDSTCAVVEPSAALLGGSVVKPSAALLGGSVVKMAA
jgi:FAD:protein FMN transferase